jgi:hypothetical protein
VPSLVNGRRSLFPSDEAGRIGGGIELSALKKLDLLLLPLPPAGDDGSCDKLSIVRSDSEGRDFLGTGPGAGFEDSDSCSGIHSGSASRNPALEDALDDAREADRNASRSPNSSCLGAMSRVDAET